jgi:imidazoleglycerol-phosphate dehydratase/histidinol-phosphatase
MKKLIKVAFVDRDGTLIFEPPDTFQVNSIKQLKILPDVVENLYHLWRYGYKLILVTNQDGLGTPKNPTDNFYKVQNHFLELLREENIRFYKIFICPHFPEDNCSCRKPKLGLISDFLKTEPIDRKLSLMIGDRKTDEQFAKNIGIRFINMETNGTFPKF